MHSDGLLVDTDVVSFVASNRSQAAAFVPLLQGKLLAVSFVTVGEMFYGASKAKWGVRKIDDLEATLKRYTVIPGTYDIAQFFGQLKAAFQDQIGEGDMWVAATALAHELPVVTNNLKHFEPMSERFGFSLLHPDRP